MSDPGITESQAHYVLSKMLDDKRLTRRDIAGYLSQMEREIKELENRLEHLKTLSGAKGGKTKKAAPAKKRVTRKPNPEQVESRKIQGVYMSLIRQIAKTKRAAYQKTAKDKGREVAIESMKKTLGVK